MLRLAVLYRSQGKHAEEKPLFKKALELRPQLSGEEHPETLVALRHMDTLYLVQGKHSETESLIASSFESSRRINGQPFTTNDAKWIAALISVVIYSFLLDSTQKPPLRSSTRGPPPLIEDDPNEPPVSQGHVLRVMEVSKVICSLLLTCVAIDFVRVAYGEDTNFKEVLKRSVEHRIRVTSFECDFHVKKTSYITSNSEEFQLKIEMSSKGTIHYDELSDILYSENTNTLDSIEGTPPDLVENTRKNFKDGLSFRLLDGQSDYLSEANSNDVSSRVLLKDIGKTDLPFPIFELGLSLPGDQDRARSLDEVAADLIHLYGSKAMVPDCDGLIWCDFSSNQLIIDSERDYWPIRRILWGADVHLKCN